MSNNKELERAELHKTIWRIANDLRGSVDGWDFKTYVLGMLFYRFVSENLTSYLNEQERRAGSADFDYAKLSVSEILPTHHSLCGGELRSGASVIPRHQRVERLAGLGDEVGDLA